MTRRTSAGTWCRTTATSGPPTSGTTTRSRAARRVPGTTTVPAEAAAPGGQPPTGPPGACLACAGRGPARAARAPREQPGPARAARARRRGCRSLANPLDQGLDQVRARLGQRLLQLRAELPGRAGTAGRDAHPVGQRHEVEIGPGQLEQIAGGIPGRLRADPVELHVEDRVRAVVEDDRGDVQTFPGV